jgi:ribosome-binding protein aMBF1 (putative translation factor)
MKIESDIGRTIARKRRRAGLTQAALAQRIGCHRTHLAMIEIGRANPSRKLWSIIDDVLNITRDRAKFQAQALSMIDDVETETGVRLNDRQRKAVMRIIVRELETRSESHVEGEYGFVCACGRKHLFTTADTR